MSEKNQTRYEKKCVICKTRNTQRFDHFCNVCVVEKRAEALDFLNMEDRDREVDPREDTMRKRASGWW